MDSFTASVLIGAFARNPTEETVNRLVDLTKELATKSGGISAADLQTVNKMTGKRCSVKYTDHKGIVIGPNMSHGGFYGGDRYPVLVRVDERPDCESQVFEYGIDQVTIE